MSFKPRLQSLIFEITQQCNHACLHCYNVWQGGRNGSPDYPRGELDTQTTINLLQTALEQSICSHVTLTGGEPLLRQDLPEILAYLKNRRIQTTMISNGHLLTEQKVTELMDLGLGTFELPLLSDRKEIHDHLSQSAGAWDAVLSAMASIRLQRGQVVTAVVITRHNYDHIAAIIRLAFAFGARAIMLNRFNPGGRGRLNMQDLLPNVSELADALSGANQTAASLGIPVVCTIPIQPCLVDITRFIHLNFSYCQAGGEQPYYTLDPMGNVRPCNHSELILGNLFKQDIGTIVSSTKMDTFKQAIPSHCSACQHRLECQGGCKAAAEVCYGSPEMLEPFLIENWNAPFAKRYGVLH